MERTAIDRMRREIKRAVIRSKRRLVKLATRVTKDESKSLRLFSEAKLMAHFSVITFAATAIGWVVYYILLLMGAHANVAFTVCYVISVVLIFMLKLMLTRRHGAVDSVASRFIKFIIVYLVSMAVGNIIVYITSSYLHDGWAIWFSYPFTFPINSLGTRFYVFKDADDRVTRAGAGDEESGDRNQYL